jgi:hypothetical protein
MVEVKLLLEEHNGDKAIALFLSENGNIKVD